MKFIRLLCVLLCVIWLAGCASSQSDSLNVIETPCDAVSVMQIWSPILSFDEDPAGLGIQTTQEGVTFVLTADNGSFWMGGRRDECLRSVTLIGKGKCGWNYYLPETTGSLNWYGTTTYVDVLIQKDSSVIGYAVIKIQRNEGEIFSAEVLKCVTFEGQQVSDAWLRNALKEAKK